MIIHPVAVLVELGVQYGAFAPNGRAIWGIWAAIFTWWGIGLLSAGVVGRSIVRFRRR